jgi:hypothetical protein
MYFPGHLMTTEEKAELNSFLDIVPVSFLVIVTSNGDVATMPEFIPTPELPTLRDLFLYMSMSMQRTS